jgi:hypothetical protein
MAKDPAQRYQRGLQFALNLRELRGPPDNLQKVPAVRRGSREREKYSLGHSATLRLPFLQRTLHWLVSSKC